MCSHFNINQVLKKQKNKMKNKIKYIRNIKVIENNLVNSFKKNKKIKIIKQNNIEILFLYKKKLCKEKIHKIIINYKKYR